MPKTVFQCLVEKKKKAFLGHYPLFRSAHEALGVILEEVAELKEEVYKRKRIKDPLRFLNELVDIAAYCELFAEAVPTWEPERNFRDDAKAGD